MRLLDFCLCHLIMGILINFIAAIDDKPTLHVWCDEDVLNRILSELSDLNTRVELISNEHSNQKIPGVQEIVDKSAKEQNMQILLQVINDNFKYMQAFQRESIEKSSNDLNLQRELERIKENVRNVVVEQRDMRMDLENQFQSINQVVNEIRQIQKENPRQYIQENAAGNPNFSTFLTDMHNDIIERFTNQMKMFDSMQSEAFLNKRQLAQNQNELTAEIKKTKAAVVANSETLQNLHKKHESLEALINNVTHNFKNITTQAFDEIKMDINKCKQIKESKETINLIQNQTVNRNSQEVQKDTYAWMTSNQTISSALMSSNRTISSTSEQFMLPSENCEISLLRRGNNDGVYRLKIPQSGLMPFDAYCLKDPEGGSGWTIIQRRQDGSENFYRKWVEYKYGFGFAYGEYWLGLENIHLMTAFKPHELWIKLMDHEGEVRHAKFDLFEIGSEQEDYFLKNVGRYSGNAGEDYHFAKKHGKFSTFDKDNDKLRTTNCAQRYKAPWWYDNDCSVSVLNGEYNNTKLGGINWNLWHGWFYTLKYTHMAIRSKK